MKKLIRVSKDGRLILPAKRIEEEGLSPGDYVDLTDVKLKKQGWSRRAFIRLSFVTLAGLVWKTAGQTNEVLGLIERGTGLDIRVHHDLLMPLFASDPGQSVSLVPAANHPFRDPPPGLGWYPIEEQCCEAYKSRFFPEFSVRTVTGYPQIRKDDDIVLFGSQVSNLSTRQLFGQPFRETPLFDIAGSGWRARLNWNLISPADAPAVKRYQYGGEWDSRSHKIVGSDGYVFESTFVRSEQCDDFLLVTSLPRYESGPQRILTFSGLHGAGQRATNLLLESPPASELKSLLKKVRREPYYQALFRVSVGRSEDGELRPRKLTLIDAKPIDVRNI